MKSLKTILNNLEEKAPQIKMSSSETDENLLDTQVLNTISFMTKRRKKDLAELENKIAQLSTNKKKRLMKKTEDFLDMWHSFDKGRM